MISLPTPSGVAVLATLDTKRRAAECLGDRLGEMGLEPIVIDMSLGAGDKVESMRNAAARAQQIIEKGVTSGRIAGVIALGGGTGSQMALSAMRALPFGFPKVLLSTLPFDPRGHVAASDVVLIPSIADIMGLNDTLRLTIAAAASAMAGLLATSRDLSVRPSIGLSAIGVTTKGAEAVLTALNEQGLEVTAFHANGFGGFAMEQWMRAGRLHGVIDFTLYELCAWLFGGSAPLLEERLAVAGSLGLPQLVVPGAIDVVWRGPIDSLSEEERRRPHYSHSPAITHVASTEDEMDAIVDVVAARLGPSKGPVVVAVPLGGLSTENYPGGQLWRDGATERLAERLRRVLPPAVRLVTDPHHINDAGFAERVVAEYVTLHRTLGEAAA